MYYLLLYDYVENIVERRAPFRERHLTLAREAHAHGDLVMAGAFADPVDGALFVFRAEDAATVEAFAKNDPYVTGGLVSEWRVRSWTVAVGGERA